MRLPRPGSAGRLTLSSARGLALACHPAPALAVTALAALLAWAAGADAALAAKVALAFGVGQLSVGWCNDWVDADRDTAVGRADKPVASGLVSRRVVGLAAATAAVLVVPTSLLLGPSSALAHTLAVASAWSYNLVLKRSVWSFLPYAVSFGLLPSVITLALPRSAWPPWWLVSGSALLGVAAHFANVLPDLDDDLRTGVRGLPHRIGRRASGVVAPAVLLAASLAMVAGPGRRISASGWAALAVVAVLAVTGCLAAVRNSGSRTPFYATIAAAAVDVALLVLTRPLA